MSYGQGVKLQYCPIQNRLKFFSVRTRKNAKNHKALIPRNLLKEKISGQGPCETSRPDVSENVELIGRGSF